MSKKNFQKHMNLLVGFFVVSAVIVIIMGLTLLLNFKGIFNPEYQLYAIFDNGIGLRKGTAVLFQGVKIGSVDAINLFQSNGAQVVVVENALDHIVETALPSDRVQAPGKHDHGDRGASFSHAAVWMVTSMGKIIGLR